MNDVLQIRNRYILEKLANITKREIAEIKYNSETES